jgi:hypothetical protein
LAWCFLLFYNAVKSQAWQEVYNLIAVSMWLVANFVWMIDEVRFDNNTPSAMLKVAIIMETAIVWICVYHLVLRPLGVFPEDEEATKRTHDESLGLKCRFSYFKTWRQYEHLHTLCWLGKDLSWNRLNPYTWVLCFVPTVLIAMDFIWTTYHTKMMMVDTAHYVAQLFWVGGNALWAIGESCTAAR